MRDKDREVRDGGGEEGSLSLDVLPLVLLSHGNIGSARLQLLLQYLRERS